MQLNIIINDEIISNPYKFILKNFELVEEDQKLFLKYDLDKTKELRIFFKSTLLVPESRENIKRVWKMGKPDELQNLISNYWIVKSSSSGVLLFVPAETEASEKAGVFILNISKSYFFPSPLYFKRSHINGLAISLFYILPKAFIFLLGENCINLLVNVNNEIVVKKYVEKTENNK
jgi:hypothetical protein